MTGRRIDHAGSELDPRGPRPDPRQDHVGVLDVDPLREPDAAEAQPLGLDAVVDSLSGGARDRLPFRTLLHRGDRPGDDVGASRPGLNVWRERREGHVDRLEPWGLRIDGRQARNTL